MNRLVAFTSLIVPWILGVTADDNSSHKVVKQVAIIGAGAAGSSTAYHLRKYAEQEGLAVNITLFEKTGRIGGRTLTVDAYGDPHQPVELGASIFVSINHILYNASRDFNLPLVNPGADEVGVLGIWDGEKFVFEQDSESWEWWSLVKLVWKYGSAPYYTRRLVRETVATFLNLYEEPYFPFRSLTTRIYELGLHRITGVTGRQFLEQNKLYGAFAHDIVQTATRVNYASNLAYIHGMGSMVSLATDGAVQVAGGNWQIFAHMVGASGSNVNLNTSVSSIALANSKDPASPSSKFVIATKGTGSSSAKAEVQDVEFDNVVIATPYQFSDITHEDGLLQQPIDEIPYTTLHVTLFATPFRFSPEFFKLEPGTTAPISVLTTLADDEEARPGPEGAGKAGFFSATLNQIVLNSKTQRQENVYKIFSPNKVTPEFLSSLLGVKIPDTFTSSVDSEDQADFEVVEPISWYHATVFHPYPQKLPRVTFQDPILREGLYYTSGMESFISTMETNALAGMNVARLIVDDYVALNDGHDKGNNASVVSESGQDQRVLGAY
ncbi:prenylcysteine oxidase [Truncatella angustata]|uniref:Prenylcysteine oxidase n=1 Tax=Truncatella angustata TaxID=152316 RepID=A0A9P8REN8_9PEZI|nr:prenylcysteine oxidase [Truncatella angustata]KAH6638701.1 prenylcysteine oxidase [Truncatella angustata]